VDPLPPSRRLVCIDGQPDRPGSAADPSSTGVRQFAGASRPITPAPHPASPREEAGRGDGKPRFRTNAHLVGCREVKSVRAPSPRFFAGRDSVRAWVIGRAASNTIAAADPRLKICMHTIAAYAGIQSRGTYSRVWMPAFAGMTLTRRAQNARPNEHHASAASASPGSTLSRILSAISPELSRIAISMRLAVSGLAFRKAFAFSRPCPRRVLS
jgi:hypothetical protein